MFLRGIAFAPLTPWSAVIINSDLQSIILPAKESAEKPPNTTECTAPILAQASIEYTAWGTIGI